MLKKVNLGKWHVRKRTLGSYNGASHTEHNGTTFVTIRLTLTEFDEISRPLSKTLTFDRLYNFAIVRKECTNELAPHKESKI